MESLIEKLENNITKMETDKDNFDRIIKLHDKSEKLKHHQEIVCTIYCKLLYRNAIAKSRA